jgi:hypothetical protein
MGSPGAPAALVLPIHAHLPPVPVLHGSGLDKDGNEAGDTSQDVLRDEAFSLSVSACRDLYVEGRLAADRVAIRAADAPLVASELWVSEGYLHTPIGLAH